MKSNSANLISKALLLFLFYSSFSYAQTPYEFRSLTDYSLLGTGILSLTTSQVLEHNTSVLSANEINGLTPDEVNSFDRSAIYNRSISADKARDYLLMAAVASPLPLLLDKNVRKDWLIVGVMGAEVLMLTYGLTAITKTTVLRARPYVYNSDVGLNEKQTQDARFSMFSGHTSIAASVTFFGAKVYADTHPDSRWKPLVWTAAAVLPALTGWASVESGNHFPTDVIVGYSIGAAVGVLIPALHIKKSPSNTGMRIQPSFNGLALNWIF